MTFAQRRIDVRFALAKTTFPNGEQLLDLAEHRVQVNIANNGGGMAMPTLSLRIFGMKLADMGALATRGLTGLSVNGDQVTVMAGNSGSLLNTIFVGTIFAAVPDFASSPEVSFVVNATSGFSNGFRRLHQTPIRERRMSPASSAASRSRRDSLFRITASPPRFPDSISAAR